MEVLSLKLQYYRNFTELKLAFDSEGALIHGKNGAGKTNLLEALSYFAFGKSFRTSSDLDLINFLKVFFRIEGSFKINNTIHKFEAAIDKTRKLIKIDGDAIARISELYRYLKVVYLPRLTLEQPRAKKPCSEWFLRFAVRLVTLYPRPFRLDKG